MHLDVGIPCLLCLLASDLAGVHMVPQYRPWVLGDTGHRICLWQLIAFHIRLATAIVLITPADDPPLTPMLVASNVRCPFWRLPFFVNNPGPSPPTRTSHHKLLTTLIRRPRTQHPIFACEAILSTIRLNGSVSQASRSMLVRLTLRRVEVDLSLSSAEGCWPQSKTEHPVL